MASAAASDSPALAPAAAAAAEVRSLRAAMPGCCVRCALRFAGVREPLTYAADEAALEAATAAPAGEAAGSESAPVDDAAPTGAACPLCLGCLTNCVSAESVAAIAATALEAGYAARSFALSFSTPVQLLLRERGAWLHLQRVRNAPAAGGYSAIGGFHAKAAPKRADKPPFHSIVELKEAVRWCIGGALAAAIALPIDPASPLTVHLTLGCKGSTETEHHKLMASLLPADRSHGYDKRKRQQAGHCLEADSVRAVIRALANPRADGLLDGSDFCPPQPPAHAATAEATVERAPVHLTGRYRKLSRSLPQSPWILDGSRKCEGSVQECIQQHAQPVYGASEARFHSAGREDVDVRMLGGGRPFMLELRCPKAAYQTAEAVAEIQARVSAGGLVEIDGLRECEDTARASDMMKEGEEAHRKDYRCIVVLSRDVTAEDLAMLNGLTDVVLAQSTPLRVLHRRTLMVRERTVHAMAAVRIAPRFLQLDCTTQAGTYVKEFVHGDFGRTVPNVGSLLNCEADIMQLDVTDLHDSAALAQG